MADWKASYKGLILKKDTIQMEETDLQKVWRNWKRELKLIFLYTFDFWGLQN